MKKIPREILLKYLLKVPARWAFHFLVGCLLSRQYGLSMAKWGTANHRVRRDLPLGLRSQLLRNMGGGSWMGLKCQCSGTREGKCDHRLWFYQGLSPTWWRGKHLKGMCVPMHPGGVQQEKVARSWVLEEFINALGNYLKIHFKPASSTKLVLPLREASGKVLLLT